MTRRKLIGIVVVVLVIAVFATVSYVAIKYALPERSFTLKSIRRVTVVGNYLVPASELLAMAGLDSPRGGDKIKPAVVEKDLAHHRLVRSAQLVRHGSAVVLRVMEVRPYFRTLIGDKKYWLCRDGELIPIDAESDKGHPYDELRKGVSLRLAGTQLLEDPAMAALILYTARRIEDILPHTFAEMRVDLRGNMYLLLGNGFPVEFGDAEAASLKLADLPHVMRVARNTPRAVKLEYLDEHHWVVKIARS